MDTPTSNYNTKNKIHKWSQEAKVEFGLSFASVVLVIFLRMFQNIQEDCNMLEDMWEKLQETNKQLTLEEVESKEDKSKDSSPMDIDD